MAYNFNSRYIANRKPAGRVILRVRHFSGPLKRYNPDGIIASFQSSNSNSRQAAASVEYLEAGCYTTPNQKICPGRRAAYLQPGFHLLASAQICNRRQPALDREGFALPRVSWVDAHPPGRHTG